MGHIRAIGTLSTTDLITEAGLGRWKVYEHRDLVEDFQARVKAAGAVPDAMRDLAAENENLAAELAKTTAALRPNKRAQRCCAARLPRHPSSWHMPATNRTPKRQ